MTKCKDCDQDCYCKNGNSDEYLDYCPCGNCDCKTDKDRAEDSTYE